MPSRLSHSVPSAWPSGIALSIAYFVVATPLTVSLPIGRCFQLREIEQAQLRRDLELHDGLDSLQYDLGELVIGTQQEHRLHSEERLLVPFLSRHRPDLALIGVPVHHQRALGAEPGLRLDQGRRARRPRQQRDA